MYIALTASMCNSYEDLIGTLQADALRGLTAMDFAKAQTGEKLRLLLAKRPDTHGIRA